MYTCVLLLSGGNSMRHMCRSWRQNTQTYVVSVTNIILYNENTFFLQACGRITCIWRLWLILNGFWCTFQCFPPTISANDVTGLKESEEKLKQQQQESARRENILVMRLATKEQEMQECTVCIYHSFPFWATEKYDIFTKIKILQLFTDSHWWPCLTLAIIVVVDY